MSIAAFGVHRPVAANLVMLAIIVGGLGLGLTLRREFFPEIRPNEVVVAAPYPGASPDEIEDSLAVKIEDRVADLEDVKEIDTTVVEGAATLRIEFGPGVNIDNAVARVKREIDALQDLPPRAERIVVEEFEPNIPVINLTLHGEASERVMKDTIRRMREDLRALPDMGDVFVVGVRTDEIAVEVREAAMLEHGLSLPAIAARVREAMRETPAGAVRSSTRNVTVRTVAADERAEEVREIVVKAPPDGRNILLKEVAEVSETFADVELRTRFNDSPAVSLNVYATGDQDVIEMSGLVKAYAKGRGRESFTPTLWERAQLAWAGSASAEHKPPRLRAYELGLSRPALGDLSLTSHSDLARFVDQRLGLLTRNALWGGVLVFLTLLALLARRVALWVTAGLVISLLGTLALMSVLGISLNFLTMFGLIVVLGLLVDDAIVVAENITARHEQGEPALSAAVTGTRQVQWPVTATVVTTIVAFLPLRMIEGRIGDMMAALPIVVICALSVSLIESLFILPSHVGHSLRLADRRRAQRGEKAGSVKPPLRRRIFQQRLIPAYSRVVDWCLRRRYLTITAAMAILTASAGLVAGGRLAFTFLTSADSEFVVADVHMPVGSPIDATDRAVRRIERTTLAMPEVASVFTLVGARQNFEGGDRSQQSHLGQLYIELEPVERRDRSSGEVIDAIRRELGEMPEVNRLRFEEAQGGPGGPDISLAITGETLDQIMPVVESIKARLGDFQGVYGIADDADAGQRELRIKLREGASELGFTVEHLAEQVRGAVYGLEAHTFAGQREDVDVRVMLDEDVRRSLARLESMRVFTPDGRPVPLSEVARLTEAEGYATIRRLNRERAVTVTADVDEKVNNIEKVMAAVGPDLRRLSRDHPGLEIIPKGRQEDLADSFRSLPIGMLAAVGMIYVILAWLFSSYVQPFAVLLAVPFAAVGAIWGHLIMGFDMTILSLIGFVALTGIVVNDALIFMEFYNHRRTEHETTLDALRAAGRARFRAIMLTTLTTALGLSPLMAEQSFQARFLIPMAITISFGLIAATAVTLIILPCLLLIGEDVRRAVRLLWTGSAAAPEPEPAG